MNDLIVVPQTAHWQRLKRLVLDSVSSSITRRVYNLGLDEFFEWYGREPRPGFTKATVAAWRVALEARGLGAVSINVRITAVRKLAVEAADNGLLAPELAAGITRVKGVASKGVRTGNLLSVKQAQTLLNTPDITTTKGLRDRAILAVLLGCGLRRSEVSALTMGHVQQRDGRWCIMDLIGKHGRVRTIPVPTWVKVATDAWTSASGVADGYIFRPVSRAGHAQGVGLSEKVVWQLLQPYAAAAQPPTPETGRWRYRTPGCEFTTPVIHASLESMMLSVQRDHISGHPVKRADRLAPVLALLLLLCGCARDHQITEITLERKGCLGPCRIYKVTLRQDGSATFVGRQNVERIGTFTNDTFWPITFEFNRLAEAVDRAGFFHLAGQYAGGFVDAEWLRRSPAAAKRRRSRHT